MRAISLKGFEDKNFIKYTGKKRSKGMEMNRKDIEIIFQIAFNMALADRKIEKYESEILDRFKEVLNVNELKAAKILDRKITLEQSISKLSNQIAKENMVKTMCALAYADGVRYEEEISMVHRANNALERPLALEPWENWENYVEQTLDYLNAFKG